MPIVAWYCKACGGRQVPLTHFADTDCGEKVHPDFAAAVLKSERSHYRFGKRAIGVTDLLGCPRAAAIKSDVEYAVDPLELNRPLTGTAWHALVASAADQAEAEVEVHGKIDGVEVVTAIDRLRKARGLIEDWKHRNDFASKYDERDGPKPEHIAQLSLGAELCEQTLGWRPSRGIIWAHYTGGVGLRPMPATLLPLSDVLAFKPWAGKSSVSDHLGWMEKWRAGQVAWSDLPLFGEAQKIGQNDACENCAVRVPCKEQAHGAAF